MRKVILYIGLLLLMLCMTQCNDKLKDDVLTVYDKQPIGLFLETQEEFSEWVKLLKYTGYYNALNVKDQYTCFVPVNDAVANWLKEKQYASVEEIPMDIARYLVKYSMICSAENYYSSSFGNGKLLDSTASGDYLITKFRTGGINAIYVNDVARIISKDVEVTNGVIHVIDHVLDPILRTVKDVVDNEQNYTIFREALKLTGMDSRLDQLYVDERKSYYTLLVVSNEIFAADGIDDVQGLIARLGAGTGDYTRQDNPLWKYVAYHLVASNAALSDLADFPENTTTKNVVTLAPNELFSVSDIKGELFLNRDSEGKQFVRFREGHTDIQARNGFLHEVDQLMPVYSPEPATVLFEFSDYAEIRALPIYRVWGSASQIDRYFFTPETAPKEIRWKTIPDRGETDWTVWYEVRGNWTSLRYHDGVGVNLGRVGWIEFDLPQIVKGKYKVSLARNVYVNRGTYQPILDGVRLGGPVNFAGGTNLIELGRVDFKTTSTHTMRFSVVKPGVGDGEHMNVDYILFEPEK